MHRPAPNSSDAPPTLVGEQVSLRPYSAGFDEQEIRRLYGWAVDEEMIDLIGGRIIDVPYPRFREIFLAQLARHNTSSEQLFALLDLDGLLIGRAGLFKIDRAGGSAEMGIMIGERARWGKGSGREAARLLVEWGLHDLGLSRIVLYTYPENVRAIRSFKAAGFESVRQVRRFSFDRGTHWELEMVRKK